MEIFSHLFIHKKLNGSQDFRNYRKTDTYTRLHAHVTHHTHIRCCLSLWTSYMYIYRSILNTPTKATLCPQLYTHVRCHTQTLSLCTMYLFWTYAVMVIHNFLSVFIFSNICSFAIFFFVVLLTPVTCVSPQIIPVYTWHSVWRQRSIERLDWKVTSWPPTADLHHTWCQWLPRHVKRMTEINI